MDKLFNVTVELNYKEEVEVERDADEFDDPAEAARALAERLVQEDVNNGAISIEAFEMETTVEEL